MSEDRLEKMAEWKQRPWPRPAYTLPEAINSLIRRVLELERRVELLEAIELKPPEGD